MSSSANRKFLICILAGWSLAIGLCGALSHAQLVLNPGDVYIIEAGGNGVPAGGISVEGGGLIIRDDADFGASDPLSVSGGVVLIESGTLTMDTFDEINITGGLFELLEPARLNVSTAQITIPAGVTLSKTGALGPAPGDFIQLLDIQSGGCVTHQARHEPGLLIQADTVLIRAGGKIDVTGKGLLGGETYDDNDQIVPGASSSPIFPPGGSHGGYGEDGAGSAAPPYGYMEAATLLGGGGGARGAIPGHPGGGRVKIVADTLGIEGDILAKGEDSVNAGAGAGGSIWYQINHFELSVAEGLTSVNGGQSSAFGGGGAGGRMHRQVENYDSELYGFGEGAISYFGGSSSASGGSWASEISVPSGPLPPLFRIAGASNRFGTYRTQLATVPGSIVVGSVEINTDEYPHLQVDGQLLAGELVTQSNSSNPLRITAGSIVGTFNVSGRGPVGGGHPDNPFGAAGQTVGADGVSLVAGSTAGSGGSYGSLGDGPSPNATYGSVGLADHVGSSGASHAGSNGGAAGGRIWIDADRCRALFLHADGAAGESPDGPGGSGGGIRLDCQESFFPSGATVEVFASGGGGGPMGGQPPYAGGAGRVTIRSNDPSAFEVVNNTPGLEFGQNDFQAPQVGSVAADMVPFSPGDPLFPFSRLDIVLDEIPTAVGVNDFGEYPPGMLTIDGVSTGSVPVLVSRVGQAVIAIAQLAGDLPDDDYVVTLRSGTTDGVHDTGGNALDGEYSGSLPSGDGNAGGDFTFTFTVQSCDDPDGDGLGAPGSGGSCPNTDNCPLVANPALLDGDADGFGDACDTCVSVFNPSQGTTGGNACSATPSFLVSSDAADIPDFSTIAAALAEVTTPDTAIRIMEGVGPYVESVTIDSLVHLIGEEPRPQLSGNLAVTVDSGISGTVRMANLVFVGGFSSPSSVLARSDTELENIEFAGKASGIVLEQGSHFATGIETAGPSKPRIFDLYDGASLELEYSDLRDAGDAIWVRGGSLTVSHTVISVSADGIVYPLSANPAASVTVRHSTIAGNFRGINSVTDLGHAPIVEYSVISDNSLSLLRVSCANVTHSNIEGDCAGPTNITSPAGFIGASNYRLQSTSPAIDHADTPEVVACLDLDGNPRLQDGDGDGINQIDLGAYEYSSAVALPAEVENVTWLDSTSLTWDSTPGAAEYHVYRGTVSTLSSGFGGCQDSVDANTTDTFFVDPEIPPSGESFTYLIGAENGSGVEGTIGMASCAERVATQCP